MKIIDRFISLFALAIVVSMGLACSSLTGNSSTSNTANANTKTNTNTSSSNTNSTASNSSDNSTGTSSSTKTEKADFTMTAEDLDKEFTHKGVKDSDLAKYENKYIQVSGRVSMLVKEKKGTTEPWVTLFAPGIMHGVNCYFDDADVGQMSKIKEDTTIKIQGFQDELAVPEVSPMLKHCTVIEGSK